jgi:hypothetical protein
MCREICTFDDGGTGGPAEGAGLSFLEPSYPGLVGQGARQILPPRPLQSPCRAYRKTDDT